MLRNHRGLSPMRRVKAVFWWCYLHTESPKLFDWVNWYNNCRLHSTLGYMTPVGFREAGLTLS